MRGPRVISRTPQDADAQDGHSIFLFVLIALGFAVFTLVVSRLLHPQKANAVKLEPYECGIEAVGDARDRYSIRY